LNIIKDVTAFKRKLRCKKIGGRPERLPIRTRKQRIAHLQEELTELKRAKTMEDELDGLVDLVYVAVGMAIESGYPFECAWNEVHAANMRKECRKTERHDHDAVKPSDWTPPNIHGCLYRHRRPE